MDASLDGGRDDELDLQFVKPARPPKRSATQHQSIIVSSQI